MGLLNEYLTHKAFLCIINSETEYRYWCDSVDSLIEDNGSNVDTVLSDLADLMLDFYEEAAMELCGDSMFGDLLSLSIAEVDWQEIADSFEAYAKNAADNLMGT